jgi:putative membrane protein
VIFAASPDVWRWQPHPEVWALIIGLGVLYVYAVVKIGPKVTQAGERVVTRAQIAWFVGALLTLWFASDWPVHDIAEEHLYSAHMVQHLLLSLVIPPMALLATPTWLGRMVVGDGRGYRVVRALTRLLPATIIFNVVVVFSHWPLVVEHSLSTAWVHYGVHMLVVTSGFIMWSGVCSPLPELRFSVPVQMGHLFLQSVVPTVPASILVFAESVAYESYDRVGEIWGMTAVEDQAAAASIMKVVAGTYLWVIIAVLFFRFAASLESDDRSRGVPLDRRSPELTYAEVEQAFAEAGPAPKES